MDLTNRLNLPLPIVRAVQNDDYWQDGHISVTGLIQPPRIRQLTYRHRNEISIDVADRIWPLLGSSTHYILERTKVDNALQEERLSVEVNGWKVTGQPDLYYNRTCYDFKTTSVWACLNGVKSDWEIQLNLYAALLRSYKFKVEALAIIAILRDWSRHQVKRSGNYPETQAVILPVKVWDPIDAGMYMEERVAVHQEAESIPDDELPVCTPEERWHKDDSWAVCKGKNKRATRVLSSEEDAMKMKAELEEKIGKKHRIDFRKGEDVRCFSYCDCNNFCNYYKSLAKDTSYDKIG